MQRTADTLIIRVGDEKTRLILTDSAVEAVQEEAAGKLVDALASLWSVEQLVGSGEGFSSLSLNRLNEMRDAIQLASEVVDVLIECRPLDELDSDE